ncbi:serine hydrolase [Streptomyces sp. ME01-18a]|uniref:serine hydrolase domain-containing protein n=1 Tax=Streptomyces sp. ME01-18a TaxID=3028669 RepID=UPI0029A468F6|nr:serine hydrolase domain-containing protein [Streptomyces sp. ME01-18a]MDX3434246.1 serine hydrolase [Streptomyces sp. ME01-18a]
MNLQELMDEQAGLRDVTAVVAGSSTAGTRTTATRGPVAVTVDSCFRIASLTKIFTSTALVRTLRDMGVSLSTPVVELLPGLAPAWRADDSITIEQILGQVSGLRESVDAATVKALGDGDGALLEAARLVVCAGNERKPGEQWSYYNGNYFLAGSILAALGGTTFEGALKGNLLDPWGLARTGFETLAASVTGWSGTTELPLLGYPRTRRPSGGLWSSVSELLSVGEGLLADRALLEEIRGRRTRSDDPMAYGLGWALGPSGQMYLNGRLPGYRAAMLLVPDRNYVSAALANQETALPALARLLSDMQQPLTGDDIAKAVDDFAA